MILGRGGQPQLREDARYVLFDGALGDHELFRDARVGAALGHEPEHLALARGELVDGIVAPASADELGDDGRVESGAALPHAAHRVRELVHVRHTVLEQIPDSLCALGQELHRIRRLDVL